MFVDVHCHLHFKQFDKDRAEVIQRAKDAGVVAILNSGTEFETNQRILDLSSKNDIVKSSLGIYPTYAESLTDQELMRDINFIKEHKQKVFAIGEVGLDFHLTKDPEKQELQKKRFRIILEELAPLHKPFVIHCRSAERETIDILESAGLKRVNFHCFTGRQNLIKRIVDNGWYFSIPSNVTRNLQFQQMVHLIPLRQLLTETDAPFLAPPPKQRSEPALVRFAVEKISELKEVTSEEAEKIIYMNFQQLFLTS